MRKTSVSDGDRDKTVLSGISGCGYVSADDNVSLPNYLVHLPSQNDSILEIDVEEDLNERVNDVNSGGDCYYAQDFGDTMREVKLERSRVLSGNYRIEQSDSG